MRTNDIDNDRIKHYEILDGKDSVSRKLSEDLVLKCSAYVRGYMREGYNIQSSCILE